MDSTIAIFLIQDGIINGAIYALLAVALVLVFAVTRVILVPQGEFVAFGSLTLAALEVGRTPGSVWLLVGLAAAAAVMEVFSLRRKLPPTDLALRALRMIVPAVVIAAAVIVLAPLQLGTFVNILLCAALIIPMGPYLYRTAFQPLADASVLVLLIAAVGAHLGLTALGLAFFGPDGYRTDPLLSGSFSLGPVNVTAQSLLVVGATLALLAGLAFFFSRTLTGKALRASAVNRRGARLVGIPTARAGSIAFAMAASIGVVSAILVAPLATIYYDSGFIIGLKGFVAAIIGGLAAYPATVAAAFGVGILEAFSSFWASAFKEVIIFASIIPILFWRSLKAGHHDEEE